ncbi:MAG: glycosyltransferase family 4 protein [Planctomycetes bacterium]|nr:glycosyltransferase family 4 protein [Planctomycetota bacterium]
MSEVDPAMGVGQVIGSFGGGGAQRLAYNLAVGLGERGMRSYAIALRSAGHYADAPPDSVKVVSLESRGRGALGIIPSMLRLRRLVSREGIRVLHVHGTSSLPFVILATAGLRPRVAVAFTWQDSERVLSETGVRRRVLIWALRRCRSVSGSCRKVADQLVRGAGLSDVGIFHGGVPATPPPGPRDADAPTILWLGRMVPSKDPQILVRACAKLREEGLRFSAVLVGKPIASTQWYFEQTRDLIRQSGLEGTVSAPGFVPDAEMATIVATAQIGVQSSHTEGMSIALMEQMMAGLAIVATGVGDTPVAIRHEQNGLLVAPQDETQLTSSLRRLITDSRLRERLAAAARAEAVNQYSIEAMTQRAMQEYTRIVPNAR